MSIIDTAYTPLMMGRVTPVQSVPKIVFATEKQSCCTEKDKQITELKTEVLMLRDLLRNK